jgi:hypothetical protein
VDDEVEEEVDDEVEDEELDVVPPPPVVRMSTHQPPLMLIEDWFWSSTIQRLHVPLGSVPLKVARLVELVGAGAGAAHTSVSKPGWGPTSSSSSTGRYVPDTSGPVSAGSWLAAWSSKVRSASTTGPEVTSLLPPASDIRITFWAGLGPETMMSASSTQCCGGELLSPVVLTSSRVTLTSVIVPVSPLTVMLEG